MTTTPDVAQQGLTPTKGQEKWRMNTGAVLYLEIAGVDRWGNRQGKELKIGPTRQGYEFVISSEDRLHNQSVVADQALDPFRNGTLTRVDADQQADPNTKSEQALTDEQIVEMLDLSVEELEKAVTPLTEVPLRRVLTVAIAMDVAGSKVSMLEGMVKDRYAAGSAQKSLTSDAGEPLP